MFFVKYYPDGRIYLHDEMRRMVRDYVWPDIDPDGGRRQQDSKLAVEYFTSQIETLTQEFEQLIEQEGEARQAENVQAEFDAFVAGEVLEQELWALREQLLFHTAFVNPQQGVKLFVKIFDEEIIYDHQRSAREVLLKQMSGYIKLAQKEIFLDELSPAQAYEVDIRKAKYLLDSAQYESARELLEGMLDRTGFRPDQQIDTRIQLANVVIRLGKFYEGIEFFKQAVQISKKNELQEWLAKAENGLGWAYRLTADRESARKHYEIALGLARKLDLKRQQALLYSNLGFIYTYIPDQKNKALSYCKASLALRKELNDKRGMGSSLSTLGCVTFMDGRFDEALSYFQQALDIFEPAQDREWLSTVYSWRGAVYMSNKYTPDLAEKDLLQALKMDVQRDKAMHQSRLGLIYMMQDKLDEAQEAVNECRKLALDLPDVLYQMVSIRDMARLARHKQEYERLEEFERLLGDYLKQWGNPQDRRALGMLYLNFGSLALGQSKFDKAIEYYKSGLKPLAELGRYGSDALEIHTQRLEDIFVNELHLEPAHIRNIGRQLQKFWRENGFDIDHPDVWIHLKKWISWEGA